jgi:hypothetical protein
MSYKNTDIILCYPGIGRTFFAQDKSTDTEFEFRGEKRVLPGVEHSSFTVDLDVLRTDDVVHMKTSGWYRYILVPIYSQVRKELNAHSVPFLLVAPKPEDKQAWIKRWMKAGATAELIAERIKGWDTIGIHFDGEFEWIYLNSDEWLGNILQQSPMSDADGRDA